MFSRVLHAQSDKDTIAAWKGDLDRLLHIFNVRSVSSICYPLTTPIQTELAIDTNVRVTGNHQEATSRATDMHEEVTSKVTDMHQDVLEIKESVSNKQSLVRRSLILTMKER